MGSRQRGGRRSGRKGKEWEREREGKLERERCGSGEWVREKKGKREKGRKL